MPNVYVREDQMIAAIRILLRDDGVSDAIERPVWSIARHLRQHRLVVTCTEAAYAIEAEFPN